ncbi:MAG: sigma factor-like helix-turn-helix DNA-binding protein, partial [Streptosporangiaceae bacterium]
ARVLFSAFGWGDSGRCRLSPGPPRPPPLTRLPAKQKQAVAYHYLAGLPYADVAAILGGTAEAARRAAADGIARLRRSYPGAGAGRTAPVRTTDRAAGRPAAPTAASKGASP